MVLGGNKQEGLERVEKHSHHTPPVLPKGVLSGVLGQLMHQHSLRVTCTHPHFFLSPDRITMAACTDVQLVSNNSTSKPTAPQSAAGLQFTPRFGPPTELNNRALKEAWLLAARLWAPTGVLRPVKSPIWQKPKTLKAFDWVICKLTWQIKLDVRCDQRRPTNTSLDESLVPHLDPNSCWWAGGLKSCSPDNIHSQA